MPSRDPKFSFTGHDVSHVVFQNRLFVDTIGPMDNKIIFKCTKNTIRQDTEAISDIFSVLQFDHTDTDDKA